MLVRTDPRLSTGAVLQVPRALAHGVLPTGLTAPTLRAFVVMLAYAKPDGSINMLKPALVEESGTRIDAAHRFLEPLRTTIISTASGSLSDGEAWFDEIEYRPGERTKYAGVVRAQLSAAARDVLAAADLADLIEIPIDEFRRLTTTPGVLLYLRLREELNRSPKAKAITMRAVVEDLHGLFGAYCAAAASKRKNADGDVELSLGLSRVTSTLLRPAVADLTKALDGFAVGIMEGRVEGSGRGVRWRHVDIVAERLAPKRTIRDLGETMRARREHEGRIGRLPR